MTREQEQYLELLKRDWAKDPADAVLYARLDWPLIAEEVVSQAQALYQSVGMQLEVQDSVNVMMGSIGGGTEYHGVGGDPELMIFLGTLAQVRMHQGEPPMAASLVQYAHGILTGQLDPLEALALAASHVPGYRQVMSQMLAMAPEMVPMLRNFGLILAALAVPRKLIGGILGLPEPKPEPIPPTPADEVDYAPRRHDRGDPGLPTPEPEPIQLTSVDEGNRFEESLARVRTSVERQEFGQAEKDLVNALEIALETPTPNDDILALDYLMLLGYSSRLSPATLESGVRVLQSLNEGNSRVEELARIATAVIPLAQSHGLSGELDPVLSEIGISLLGKSIPKKERLPLTLATAGALHRTGDTAEAASLLSAARERFKKPDDQLDIAVLDADLHWDNGDREGAADVLVRALESREHLAPEKVSAAIQKLVCCWPDERAGIDPFMEELQRIADGLEEPQRTFYLLTASIAQLRAGNRERAGRLSEGLDLDQAEQMVPEALKDMVGQVRESVEELSGRA